MINPLINWICHSFSAFGFFLFPIPILAPQRKIEIVFRATVGTSAHSLLCNGSIKLCKSLPYIINTSTLCARNTFQLKEVGILIQEMNLSSCAKNERYTRWNIYITSVREPKASKVLRLNETTGWLIYIVLFVRVCWRPKAPIPLSELARERKRNMEKVNDLKHTRQTHTNTWHIYMHTSLKTSSGNWNARSCHDL